MITESKLIDREIRAEFANRADEVEHVTLYNVGESAMCLTYRPQFRSIFSKRVTPGYVGRAIRRG